MKIVFILGTLVCAIPASSQEDAYILANQGSVSVRSHIQSWTMEGQNRRITEVGTVLSVKYPVLPILNFSFRTSQATTYGDFKKVSGWSDVQLGVAGQIESAHLLLSVGANIPSGKTELSADEFQTAALVSNPIFDFGVPAWGQGFNINPGVAWAYEAGRNVVVGVAASYQYKGAYRPQENITEYDPGDEIVFTGGADFRLNESSSTSVDIVFTSYGTDKVNGTEVFVPGSAISVNAQYKKHFKNDELWLYGRYRSKAKGDFPTRVEPNRTEFQAGYTLSASRSFSFGIRGSARFFEETDAALSGAQLFGFELVPTCVLSPSVRMPIRIRYVAGSGSLVIPTGRLSEQINGFEAGISLVTDF